MQPLQVPIAAEILRKAGVYDPRKLFGVTTLDVVRAEAFIGEILGGCLCATTLRCSGGGALVQANISSLPGITVCNADVVHGCAQLDVCPDPQPASSMAGIQVNLPYMPTCHRC
jgi:hypothetical protein